MIPPGTRGQLAILGGILGLLALVLTHPDPPPGIPARLHREVFVAFDVETTGLSPAKERIVELGAVRFRPGLILARTNWLINPQQPIPAGATRVHGIHDAEVAHAPTFEAVYPAFERFVGDAVLMAHNARFDVGFVSHEARRAGLPPLPNPVIDTLPLTRAWFRELSSHRLSRLADHTDTPIERSHRADDDALTLARVVSKGMGTMPVNADREDLEDAAGGVLHFE